MVPIPSDMVEDFRKYWMFHRHPQLLFPYIGRGDTSMDSMRRCMHGATDTIPVSSLQRLIVIARKELNLPCATVHTLRHSFATHLRRACSTRGVFDGYASIHPSLFDFIFLK